MSRSSSPSDRADVYTRITAEIIAAIEAGAGECRLPWHHDGTVPLRVWPRPRAPVTGGAPTRPSKPSLLAVSGSRQGSLGCARS